MKSIALCTLLVLSPLLLAACGDDDPTAPVANPLRAVVLTPPAGGAEVRAAVLDGRYVYTATRTVGTSAVGRLSVYDAGSAAGEDSLDAVAEIDLPNNFGGLAKAGSILYCGVLGATRLVDVSDPLNPQLLATPVLAGGYNGVRVDGNQLLVFDNNDLAIYDVGDPANPTATHTSTSNCFAGDVYGERFVMGQINPQRFLLYDVSQPGTFDNFGSATTTVGGSIYFARILDQNLYVLVEYFSESRSELITYDLAPLDVDGSVAVVDTLRLDRRFRSLASNESTIALSSLGRTLLFDRAPDGRLGLREELEGVGGGTTSGFPHDGFVEGDRIALAGQPAILLTR